MRADLHGNPSVLSYRYLNRPLKIYQDSFQAAGYFPYGISGPSYCFQLNVSILRVSLNRNRQRFTFATFAPGCLSHRRFVLACKQAETNGTAVPNPVLIFFSDIDMLSKPLRVGGRRSKSAGYPGGYRHAIEHSFPD